jgi:DNA-binding transcriptional ArsR family regulator
MQIVRTLAVSPRLELFFALAAALGEDERRGDPDGTTRWLDQARRRLDQTFRRRLGPLVRPAGFWVALAALPLPRAAALTPDVKDVIEALAMLPAHHFPPADDREALQRLVVDSLRRFDRLAFAALWRPWREELMADAPGLEAILAGLPIDPSATTKAAIFLPSRFAPPGCALPLAAGDAVLIPFDPDRMPLRATPPRPVQQVHVSAPNPAPIFRALGDATRYTIAGMIAREPLTSAELARRLDIAKPTMAHHLRALRAAGLVIEETRGTRIVLTLDRTMVEALSDAAVAQLFGASNSPPILRSRRSVG